MSRRPRAARGGVSAPTTPLWTASGLPAAIVRVRAPVSDCTLFSALVRTEWVPRDTCWRHCTKPLDGSCVFCAVDEAVCDAITAVEGNVVIWLPSKSLYRCIQN